MMTLVLDEAIEALSFGKGVILVVLGIVIGAMLATFYTGSFPVRLYQANELALSYADLAAIMLGAVSVLVTILGVGVAILAIWGYSQFKMIARKSAANHVEHELHHGALRTEVEHLVVRHIGKELETESVLRRLLTERVDHLILTDADKRSKKEERAVNENSEYGD